MTPHNIKANSMWKMKLVHKNFIIILTGGNNTYSSVCQVGSQRVGMKKFTL